MEKLVEKGSVMRTKLSLSLAAVLGLLSGKMSASAAQSPENMALIPAGLFQMGNSFYEGNEDESPVHSVYVSAFYMDETEVPKTLWDEVYEWAISHSYSFDNKGSAKYYFHPVISINWYDVVKWCNARSEKEGRAWAYYTDANQTTPYRAGRIDIQNSSVNWNTGYRLPTEAEWEKAARGGLSGKRFPWGNTISHNEANYDGDGSYDYDTGGWWTGYHPDYSNWPDNAFPYTAPVGAFAANRYGLYNMAGNVWEYCWDWYESYYYYSSQVNNPTGPETGQYRVVRGGSWYNHAQYCRSTSRNATTANSRYFDVGFRTVLSSTSPDPIKVIATPTVQPTYSEPPKKEAGKDSLVVVTHGWQPALKPVDIEWVKTMTNALTKYLEREGKTDWQVHAYRWVDGARPPAALLLKGAQVALDNGKEEGESLGKWVIEQGFTKVHLIGHSAAGKLLQTACETIKAVRPNIVVHLTFLDPFVGFDYAGVKSYGKGADWAENYFSKDALTSPIDHRYTEGPLENAYNIDVTFLDTKNRVVTEMFRSSQSGTLERCFETRTTHSWPYEFYLQTIPPNTISDSKGFGFLLSEEAGGLAEAMVKYDKRGNTPEVLGTPDPPCPTGNLYATTPSVLGPTIEFKETSSVKSPTGTIKLNGFGITLTTGSPAWVVGNLVVTNRANFLSFESHFSSGSRAEGLLSVYLGTNVLGVIDERVAPAGTQTNKFVLAEIITLGTVSVGFRLDAFSGTSSSITVTNVSFGFVGLDKPFSLSTTGVYEKGKLILQLTGPVGYSYVVEASTNLTDWTPTALLFNTGGTVRFVDSNTNNATAQFYRAIGH